MADPKFFIWSEEHRAWWRPNSNGYTDYLRQAGRYTEPRARAIIHSANMGGDRFNELAFPVPDDFDDLKAKETQR